MFGDLMDFLMKAFPSLNSKLSISTLELLEVLADEDYYENVVIEEENKKKFFAHLSKNFKSKVILILNQSCHGLSTSPEDQRYKYLVLLF